MRPSWYQSVRHGAHSKLKIVYAYFQRFKDARFLFFSDFFGTTYESGVYVQSRAVYLNEDNEILISGIRTNQSSEYRETTLNTSADYNMSSSSESYFAWG